MRGRRRGGLRGAGALVSGGSGSWAMSMVGASIAARPIAKQQIRSFIGFPLELSAFWVRAVDEGESPLCGCASDCREWGGLQAMAGAGYGIFHISAPGAAPAAHDAPCALGLNQMSNCTICDGVGLVRVVDASGKLGFPRLRVPGDGARTAADCRGAHPRALPPLHPRRLRDRLSRGRIPRWGRRT